MNSTHVPRGTVRPRFVRLWLSPLAAGAALLLTTSSCNLSNFLTGPSLPGSNIGWPSIPITPPESDDLTLCQDGNLSSCVTGNM